jgi:hypothetical protein
MATYKDLQETIALDYLNRVDLLPEVRRAIQRSIKATEAERFWFNETATALVAATAVAVPTNFLALDRLEITIANADYQMFQRSFDEIRDMNVTRITGQPTNFAYHANAFQLALYPDSAYAMICYYIKSLPVLAIDTDSNPWTNELANYIGHLAALDMCMNVIVADQDMVSRHSNALTIARNELNLRNTGRLTFRLRATQF